MYAAQYSQQYRTLHSIITIDVRYTVQSPLIYAAQYNIH